MIDFHVHTTNSPDGNSELNEYCLAAKSIGCEGFCVTDHVDLGYFDSRFEGRESLPAGWKAFKAAVKKYPGLKLRFGVEAGYIAETAQETALMLSGYPLDYCINSVHQIDGVDPYFGAYFDGKSRDEAYTRYLQAVYESLDTPVDYQVIGHLGYVFRNAPYPVPAMQFEEQPELYDAILMRLVYMRKGLEINTSSLKSAGSAMPTVSVLKRYKQLGGEIITLGSDAHSTERLCKHFDYAREMLLDCGFTYIADFIQGKPEFIKL